MKGSNEGADLLFNFFLLLIKEGYKNKTNKKEPNARFYWFLSGFCLD